MDTERLLNYLFGAYIVVVLVVWALGGGDASPEVYGLNIVNLGLLMALIILIFAYIYQSGSVETLKS